MNCISWAAPTKCHQMNLCFSYRSTTLSLNLERNLTKCPVSTESKFDTFYWPNKLLSLKLEYAIAHKMRLCFTSKCLFCANCLMSMRIRNTRNRYQWILFKWNGEFQAMHFIHRIKTKFMDYLLTTMNFYCTIKRTMSGLPVKLYIISFFGVFSLFCFLFWNVAGHSVANNRVSVNHHSVKDTFWESTRLRAAKSNRLLEQ